MPFVAMNLPKEAHAFLFACGFWIVAADERLKPVEKAWLVQQFGLAATDRLLDQFVPLDGPSFFSAFDSEAEAVSDDIKRVIYPQLVEWMKSCAMCDGTIAPQEQAIIDKICRRLDLNKEIVRLTRDGAPPPPPPPVPVRPAAPPRPPVPPVAPPKPPPAPVPAPPRPPVPVHPSVDAGEAPSMKPDPADWVEKTQRLLVGHEGVVLAVGVDAAGNVAATGSEDCTVRLWNLTSGDERSVVRAHAAPVTAVVVDADGAGGLSADRSGRLMAWDAVTGLVRWSVDLHGSAVTALSTDRSGRLGAAADEAGGLVVLDLRHGDIKRTLLPGAKSAIRDVSFVGDAGLLASGGDDGFIRIWDVEDGNEVTAFEAQTSGVTQLASSPGGDWLVSGGGSGSVKAWKVDSGERLWIAQAHGAPVGGLKVSPDGRSVLSAGRDGLLCLWRADTGQRLLRAECPRTPFALAAFRPSPSGLLAASTGAIFSVWLTVSAQSRLR